VAQVSQRAGLRGRLALPGAIVLAVLVAEGAVWLLRPDDVIDPAEVPESRYFTATQLEHVRDFAAGQRALGLGALALQGALLGLLVARPPRRSVRLVERAGRGRPLVAAAIGGAALAVTLRLAPLPLSAIARQRSIDVGLVTQDWAGWAEDVAKATAIAAAGAAAGAAIFLSLMRRFPRRWWIGGAIVTVTVAIVFTWLAPVVLEPLFNRFEKLPEGRTRSDLIALADRAGVKVDDVQVVDASRRTRAANAYVTGIGQTKRIVLYDTLLERFSPEQVEIVVAHELGHVKHRDVPRGILWVALVAPAGMYVVMLLTGRWSARAGARPGSTASLPAFAVALALVSFGATVISNQLSRRVEASADTFAIEQTRAPAQFISMQRRLTLANVSDPDPPQPLVWLFGTHPPAIDRIGTAVAYDRPQ
jgi:Zn-dependent protease with chaperone function